MEKKKCPDCNGTGRCPHCKGTGKTRFGQKCFWCAKFHNEEYGDHLCSRCKGKGALD